MPAVAPDVFGDVIGQDRAVDSLRAAAVQPVHAYLLVGNAGWGTRAAARAFASLLLSEGLAGDEAERAVDLALGEQHPDFEVFETDGASLRVEHAEAIIRAAARSPIEGQRKVLLLVDFHKVERAGPMLLKTIEEPSASTVFVILADEITEDLVTIASRAVRIDFGPVPPAEIAARLEAEGVVADRAAEAAASAGGDLERARLLATDERLALRRQAWHDVPRTLDGTGAMAHRLVREMLAHIDDAQQPLDAQHVEEVAALQARIDAYGQRGSGAKDLETRHKREVRKHRTDEVRFGLATMAGAYRDALATGADAGPILDSLDRIQAAADAMIRNPTEGLLLFALFAGLSPVR